MARASYPRDTEIIAALLRRAKQCAQRTGLPQSAIGKSAVNDSAFLFQVAKGRNITLRSYQRLMDWIDQTSPRLYERQKKKSMRRVRRGRSR